MITAAAEFAPSPAGLAATPKLCAIPAPAISPITKIAESLSPSALLISCLPGQPPPRVKHSPQSSIAKKFHSISLCAIGCFSKPRLNCPSARFTSAVLISKAIIACIMAEFLSTISVLIAPTEQKPLF